MSSYLITNVRKIIVSPLEYLLENQLTIYVRQYMYINSQLYFINLCAYPFASTRVF